MQQNTGPKPRRGGAPSSTETRYDTTALDSAARTVGEARAAAKFVNVLFGAYGLDVHEVQAVCSRMLPERLTELQAMSLGVLIGLQLAESGPTAGEGVQG